jgi:hypothetical protein
VNLVSLQTRSDKQEAACGPLLTFDVCCAGLGRRGKGTPGQATALRLGGRRCAPTPLRCSVSWPRRRTHSATCGRYVRTASTSQKTKRAARAATSPVLLGTSEARLRLPGRAFAEPAVACETRRTSGGLRGRRCPRGAISVATRSAAPGDAGGARWRHMARAAEARWQRGDPRFRRSVDGVPTTLKENIATQGVPVPLGTAATELVPARRTHRPPRGCARPERCSWARPRCPTTACCRRGCRASMRWRATPGTRPSTRAAPAPARPPGRRGLRPAAPGHRHRRLDPAAGRLVRHRHPEAEPGPHPDPPAVPRPRGRPDDAHRGRCRWLMTVLRCPTRATR